MLRSRSLPFLAALLGFAFTVAAYSPGLMSPDSVAQLGQARAGAFTDWHPPLMSLVWKLLDSVVPGPLGMLLLQNLVFWGALAWTASLLLPTSAAAMAATWVFGFFPPVFALLGTIWKDVGLGASLLLAFAILLSAERNRGRPTRVRARLALAFPVLFYAISVRHNAAPALLPFTFWAASLVSRRPLRWTAGGLGLFAALAIGASAVSGILTGHHSMYPVQQILTHDLTAISVQTGENLLPDFLQQNRPFTSSEIRNVYSPETVVFLYCCDNSTRRLTMVADAEHLSRLKSAWFHAVHEHPGAYLLHRARTAKELIGWRRDQVCYPFQNGMDENPYGYAASSGLLYRGVMKLLRATENSFLFRGWIVLLALLGLGAYGLATLRKPGRLPFLVLVSSGLLYLLPYFLIATTCDFRMIWWSVLTFWLSPLALVKAANQS